MDAAQGRGNTRTDSTRFPYIPDNHRLTTVRNCLANRAVRALRRLNGTANTHNVSLTYSKLHLPLIFVYISTSTVFCCLHFYHFTFKTWLETACPSAMTVRWHTSTASTADRFGRPPYGSLCATVNRLQFFCYTLKFERFFKIAELFFINVCLFGGVFTLLFLSVRPSNLKFSWRLRQFAFAISLPSHLN